MVPACARRGGAAARDPAGPGRAVDGAKPAAHRPPVGRQERHAWCASSTWLQHVCNVIALKPPVCGAGQFTERAQALLMVGQMQIQTPALAPPSSALARAGSVREIKSELGHHRSRSNLSRNASQLKQISEDDDGLPGIRSMPLASAASDESGGVGLFRAASARVPTLSTAAPAPKQVARDSDSLMSRTQSTAVPAGGGSAQDPASGSDGAGAGGGFALVNKRSPALVALTSSFEQRNPTAQPFWVVLDYLKSAAAVSAGDLSQLGGGSINVLQHRMDGLSILRQMLERVSQTSRALTFVSVFRVVPTLLGRDFDDVVLTPRGLVSQDVIWVIASLVNSPVLADAHIVSGLWLPAIECCRLKAEFFQLLSSVTAEMEQSINRLAGPGPKPAAVLPYDGNIQKAMQAQDRDAIRTIMAAKNQEPEPELSVAPATIELNLQLVRMCLRCFGLTFQPADFEWVHESRLLTLLGQVERTHSFADKSAAATPSGVSVRQVVAMDSKAFELKATSNEGMLASLVDKKTDSFWEPGGNDHGSATIRVILKEPMVLDHSLIRVHIDNTRDGGQKQVAKVAISFIGVDGKALPKLLPSDGLLVGKTSVRVDTRFAGWVQCSTAAAGNRQVKEVKLAFDPRPGNRGVRVRGLRLLHVGGVQQAELPSVQQPKAEVESMEIFRTLAGRVLFSANGEDADGGVEPLSRTASLDLRQRVVGKFELGGPGAKLGPMQLKVCKMLYQELRNQAEVLQTDGGSEPGGLAESSSAASEADTYCFEIMTLILALSGSKAGRQQIAKEPEVICATCVVLQSGSPRSQRQAVQILKRVVLDTMAPADADVSLGPHSPAVKAHGFAGYLLACLASAFSVQLKRPGTKAAFPALDKDVAGLEQLAGAELGWELAQDHLLKIVRAADDSALGWNEAFRTVAATALAAMPTVDPAGAAADPQVGSINPPPLPLFHLLLLSLQHDERPLHRWTRRSG